MRNIQNLDLPDYIDMLKRRILWILLPTVIVGFGTYLFLKTLPDIYESETVILVEPPKVPTDYVRQTTTGSIQTRLSTITQQILSRTRLEKIIIDTNLYPDQRKTTPMEDVVQAMRKDIDLKVTKSDAFSLSFRAQDPSTAQRVTTQLASLYIEESLKVREEQTEGVSQFLETQLKETKEKLIDLESRLGSFKLRNMGALPEQQSANLAVLSRLQLQLQGNVDSINRLEEQKSYQRRMLTELKSLGDLEKTLGIGMTSSASTTRPTQSVTTELDLKRAERAKLLRRYTKDHPDVRKLDSEIAVLQQDHESRSEPAGIETTANAVAAVPQSEMDSMQVKSQLEMLDAQIKQALKEQQKIRQDMATYQSRVDAVPRVEQLEKEISRDYDITLKHYQNLLAKMNDAAMATSLEKRQKGEQFRILDPASFPQRPSMPDRPKLTLLGVLVGLAIGIGISLLLELMDSAIRSESEVLKLTGLPLLVSIPVITFGASNAAGEEETPQKRFPSLLTRS